MTGQDEARAQRIQRLQHFQPLFRPRRQSLIGRRRHIGVGALLGPAHPAAKLIKLRQTEPVCAVDDQRVGGGNIQPAFDDRCGQKHVVPALIKGRHFLFQLARAHLAVRRHNIHFRHAVAEEGLNFLQVLNARHHEEALPAPVFLAQQRLADRYRVERGDTGPHGQTVDRRRGNDAQLPYAGQRLLQRARNGRRGQGQDMGVAAQLFQPLLVAHTEALLLVHHQQTQIIERNMLGQQRMRADHDIARPALDLLPRLRRFSGGHQPGQLTHLHRPAADAFGEILVMLPRQQGRRRNHRHLPPGHRHHEGRAQRHFRLAEAHIAADQPVHRAPGAQILEHVLDGGQLIVRLRIGEARREFVIAALGRVDGVRLPQRALGGDLDQLVRHVAQALLGLGLPRLPARPAQLVQRRVPGVGAIARQQLDIFDRQEQLVLTGIFQLQTVMRRVLNVQRFQPDIARNAVIDMDNQVAGRQR